MNFRFQFAAIGLVLAAFGQAHAAPINIVAPGSLAGGQVATFDDVAGGASPGTNYNAIFVSGGVRFGERFAGQSNTPVNGFDVLTGTPGGPLTVVAGAPNANLNIFLFGQSNVLTGLGPVGFPDADAIGEGSVAALFSSEQSEFGFDIVGGDGGSATLSFFRRNGSLIDTLVLSGLSNTSYAFRREGNLLDIAGVSIFNSDPGGIGFDNVRFNVPSGGGGGGGTTPEPGTFALVALALLSAYAVRRKLSA